jgi:hypothetical protein
MRRRKEMTTSSSSRRRKRIENWFKKSLYEAKEFEGTSDEEIQDRAEAQMDMVIAPINEAYRRGEISPYEAIRRIKHEEIKLWQEYIKEAEEDIWHLLNFGRSDTKNPKLVEKQHAVMEKQRREDPTIQKLLRQIEEYKKEVVKSEQDIQKTYSQEAGEG